MKKFFIQLGAVLLVALALQSFQGPIPRSPLASAAAVDELRGWAWSSNIGWVSFNCADGGNCGVSNYRVLASSASGHLSGYAWSSNIGWIQFDPSGPYPAAGPNRSARVDNPGSASSTLSGWARALSYNVGNGGWDGWIKMNGVSVSGSDFSGFAWGGDVVGWVSFNCADAGNCDVVNYKVTRSGGPEPACTFAANPNTIIVAGPGGSGATTLSWLCVNVSSCSIDHDVGPAAPPESGSKSGVNVSSTTTFTLSCSGGAGATTKTLVEVKVFTPTRQEIRP